MKEFKPVILWISLSLNLFLIVRQIFQINCGVLENEISRIREKIARDNQHQLQDRETKTVYIAHPPVLECKSSLMKNFVLDFEKIGKQFKSDKVISQSYQNMYGLYLGPRREEKLRILEIGPGCVSDDRAEKSIKVWRDYIPASHVTYFGRDRLCLEKLRKKADQIFVGNQSDMAVIEKVANGGPYDVIVDEGERTRKQQVTALVFLWPKLKSGGVYFLEGLNLWHEENFDDSKVTTFEMVGKLIYMLINQKGDTIVNPNQIKVTDAVKSIFLRVLSVNCFYHGCAIVKK